MSNDTYPFITRGVKTKCFFVNVSAGSNPGKSYTFITCLINAWQQTFMFSTICPYNVETIIWIPFKLRFLQYLRQQHWFTIIYAKIDKIKHMWDLYQPWALEWTLVYNPMQPVITQPHLVKADAAQHQKPCIDYREQILQPLPDVINKNTYYPLTEHNLTLHKSPLSHIHTPTCTSYQRKAACWSLLDKSPMWQHQLRKQISRERETEKMFLFWMLFLCFVRHVVSADTCVYNTCYCPEDGDVVICGHTDDDDPKFTYMERLFTRELYLSAKQRDMITTLCTTFPRLEALEYEGEDLCPTIKCAKVKCPWVDKISLQFNSITLQNGTSCSSLVIRLELFS